MLEVPIDFTSNIEVFVAHSGPKISYTFKPLGKEFFIEAQTLLFEQGIEEIPITVEKWEGIPCFFKSTDASNLPYDIFAAAFYLITRYEEALVHLKDDMGRYSPSQSLAYRNDFLSLPVIDHWMSQLHKILRTYFSDFPIINNDRPLWQPLFDIALPYRYLQRSFFAVISDFIYSLSRFQIFKLYNQVVVLLHLKKDPYDNYNHLERLSKHYTWQPHFFILYAENTPFESTTSIYNSLYQSLIKGLSDFAKVSLMLSYDAQRSKFYLQKDKNNLNNLTHRTIRSVRMHRGLVDIQKIYSHLVEEEISTDFSMGYPETIGYRAGTSVPFHYYDLDNELQLPLVLYPVVASSSALHKSSASKAFAELRKLYENLPLSTACHSVAFTNEILNKDTYNLLWADQFINYLKWHAKQK